MPRSVVDTVILGKDTDGGPTYSTAQLTISKNSEGGITFAGEDGIQYQTSDEWAYKLFAAVDALT